MNYILLPSLQHAAIVRFASLLYHDQEIESLLKKEQRRILSYRLGHSRVRIIIRNEIFRQRNILYNDSWVLLEKKIFKKLSSLLPATVNKGVTNAIHHMHDEVKRWKKDHEFLLEYFGECSCKYLSWKTDGTMNRIETAKKLVKNDKVDSDIRFIVACTYFLQDEILTLWTEMKKQKTNRIWTIFKRNDVKRITRKGTNLAVRFWITWLEKESIHPWNEMVYGYFGHPIMSMRESDTPLRVSSFFQLLSRRSKEYYISYLRYYGVNPRVHADDFQTCVNEMDETQRIEMFGFYALKICMRWPFRSLFIKMAEDVFRYYSEIDTSYLKTEYLIRILFEMFHSFIYENNDAFYLFEEFWQMCPAVMKEEAKRDFTLRSIVFDGLIKYNTSQDLKTVLRKFLRT